MKNRRLPYAELLMAAVIILRSSGIMFNKIGLRTFTPFNFLAIRFGIGFLALAAVFRKRLCALSGRGLLRGLTIGLAAYGYLATEMLALKTLPTSTESFIENIAIILVPVTAALITRKMPSAISLLSSLLALIGVAFLTFIGSGFVLSEGVIYALLAALCYTAMLLVISRFSKLEDSLCMGILQIGGVSLFSLITAFAAESPRLPETAAEWGILLYTGLIVSGVAFTLQPVAQRNLSADRASIFCALAPVTVTLLGVIFLEESVTVYSIIGGLFILAGLLLPHLIPHKETN